MPSSSLVGHPAEHQDPVAGGQAAGLGPVGLGGQRFEVVEGVGDLDRHLTAVPAQAGDPVRALHQPGRHPQRPPQLVLHPQHVAAPADGGRAVDDGGGPGPRRQHGRGHHVVLVVVEGGDVQRQRRGVQVRGDRGGPVEHAADRAGAQQPEGVEQVAGIAAELLRAGAGGDGQQLRGRVGQHPHHVGDRGLAGRVGGHRQVQADVEQPPLGHGDLRAAHDHHQGLEQRQPAGPDGLPQPVAVGAGGLGERGAQRSGVERVERVQTTADPPDPPAEVR